MPAQQNQQQQHTVWFPNCFHYISNSPARLLTQLLVQLGYPLQLQQQDVYNTKSQALPLTNTYVPTRSDSQLIEQAGLNNNTFSALNRINC